MLILEQMNTTIRVSVVLRDIYSLLLINYCGFYFE